MGDYSRRICTMMNHKATQCSKRWYQHSSEEEHQFDVIQHIAHLYSA